MKKIAVEEAFLTHEISKEWDKVLSKQDAEPGFLAMGKGYLRKHSGTASLHEKLLDLGPLRIAEMDATGIDLQIISLCSPGVQVIDDGAANALARHANDVLLDAINTYPTRFSGLAAIAPQDPKSSVVELERAKKCGLKGVIINSHTRGEYLDNSKYWPILEACQDLDFPLYLHPREPSPAMVAPYLDYGLYFAGWGFAAEAGLHAMRLIMSGIFDHLPKLRIVLGHLGEGIPFWLQRIDNRYIVLLKAGVCQKLNYLPSEYFRNNFVITTSGMYSSAALALCLEEVGIESVLFAADYPHERSQDAVEFIDTLRLSVNERDSILWRNATRTFKL